MIFFFAMKVMTGQATASGLLPHLAASLVYMHNAIYSTMSTITPIAWSLEVEVQFYLLAPLLALIFMLRSGVRKGVLIAAIIATSLLQYALELSKLTLLGNLQYFLVGFLVLELRLTRATLFRPHIGVDVVCGAALVPLLLLGADGDAVAVALTVADLLHLLLCAAPRWFVEAILSHRMDHGHRGHVLFDLTFFTSHSYRFSDGKHSRSQSRNPTR